MTESAGNPTSAARPGPTGPALVRRLSTFVAVMIGLSSMIGAGVFFIWAPAVAAGGQGLLIGLVIAGIIATLNALSSAQLAMAYPVSGGAYSFGRATIGEWWGFSAGWLFLAGKTASAAAIALIAATYLVPAAPRLGAVVIIAVLAGVNMTGIRSTSAISTVVVSVVVVGLVALLATPHPAAAGTPAGVTPLALDGLVASGGYGILQSAGLLFFCFAGYARMATLGEEVRDPRRALPRAILIALALVLVLYAVAGVTLVTGLGVERLSTSVSPFVDLVDSGGQGGQGGGASAVGILVRLLAGLACLGSLIGILAGLSRTSLAMARNRDLPGRLALISQRTNAPIVAEATMAVIAVAGVLLLDPAQLVGFSATSVLVYYAIAHVSAFRQQPSARWLWRGVQCAGVAGCLLLVATLPWQGVVASVVVLAVGLALRYRRIHK